MPQAFPCNIHQTISATCHAAFSGIAPLFPRDIDPRFSRGIHLERGPALSGHCEAGGLSQWKHFPSICTANMPHRYAWLVGGCADDCHEPDELFARTSLRHSASIAHSIPVGICPHCLRHFLAISIRQYPQLATRHSVALPHYFHVTLTQDFPATFIWNGDLPSQGIVRQVGCPNGSISPPSAQPTCHTDMRGWWVGVQMIVTSQKSRHASLRSGIV